jgi:phosphate transport system substrate-binding protein
LRYSVRTRGLAVGAFALLAAVLVACGSGGATPDGGSNAASGGSAKAPATPNPYAALGGELRVDGSSTVFPIAEAVAEEFSKVAKTRVNVAFSGTGGGFEKFCRGEIQISNASRKINDREKAACATAGINDVVELQVAIDALSVVVHPRNSFAACLTTKELNSIFKVGGATRWSEVRAGFPDQPIKTYYPGADSGTFTYFVEAIITGVDRDSKHRGDGTASEDDNILAQGLENDPNSIGYFGFAYFLEAGQKLKAVSVDGGKGCVTPSRATALDGTYAPLSRPLFVYTRETFLRERPEVLGFSRFLLDSVDKLVPEVGYVQMPPELKNQQVAKLTPFIK